MEDFFKLVCELPTWMVAMFMVASFCSLFVFGFKLYIIIATFVMFVVLVLNIASKAMK